MPLPILTTYLEGHCEHCSQDYGKPLYAIIVNIKNGSHLHRQQAHNLHAAGWPSDFEQPSSQLTLRVSLMAVLIHIPMHQLS